MISEQVWMQLHWGVDGWNAIADTPMSRRTDGAWWARVTPPCNATTLDYVFTNGMGAWALNLENSSISKYL